MRLTFKRPSGLRAGVAAVVFAVVGLSGCQGEVDFTRKPVEREQASTAPITGSPIFVVTQSRAQPLLNEVESRIPKRLLRLASNLSRAACVEKNGRKRCYTARVTGDVVRNGPARLKGTTGGLTVEIPGAYTFEVRGRGRAREITKRVTGEIVLSAPFDVSLGAEWAPRVRFTGGVKIEGGEAIPVLARTLDIATPLSRKLRTRFAALARTLESSFDTNNAAGTVDTAWRYLHYPVALNDEPPLWLRGDPQSISFGGIGVYDDSIELRIAIVGKVGTFSGERPLPLIARQTPALDTARLADPASHLVMPVELPYAELAPRIEEALRQAGPVRSKGKSRVAGFKVESLRLFPADGRLVLAVKMTSKLNGAWQSQSGTAYVLATPSIDQQSGVLGVKLAGLSAPNAVPDLYEDGAFVIPEAPLVAAFEKGIAVDLRTRFASVLGDINRIIDVPFAKNNRLRGRFEDLRVHSIETKKTSLRINLDLVGALSIYPGAPNLAAELELSKPVSAEQ